MARSAPVVPAHAGVAPLRLDRYGADVRDPRTCGADPKAASDAYTATVWSPRMRVCSRAAEGGTRCALAVGQPSVADAVGGACCRLIAGRRASPAAAGASPAPKLFSEAAPSSRAATSIRTQQEHRSSAPSRPAEPRPPLSDPDLHLREPTSKALRNHPPLRRPRIRDGHDSASGCETGSTGPGRAAITTSSCSSRVGAFPNGRGSINHDFHPGATPKPQVTRGSESRPGHTGPRLPHHSEANASPNRPLRPHLRRSERFFGGAGGTRTHGRRIMSPLL